ncbi:hypothetical protein [Siphonobacter sp. SORGH_AS_0500]|uniref:hypothetical protein n=1 Tax=Siphonobacter sp. SORGH_AS_0500 TaxID=1864824 RepID=UPI002866CDEB|nr:hypothetical protein [Siphonobacter sp. SORGH_AS_0500]MDR6197473.1 hypothetical protein [Siphonobacter sp. SORGH_AS_0500]
MDLTTPSSSLFLWSLILGIYALLYLLSFLLVIREKGLSPLLKGAVALVLLVTPFIGPILYIAFTLVVKVLHRPATAQRL